MNAKCNSPKSIDLQFMMEEFEISEFSPTWLVRKKARGSVKSGPVAGAPNHYGYFTVMVKRRVYFVHRIIWALHNMQDPLGWYIDHIDGNRTNNNPSNLRTVTISQNNQNAKIHNSSKTGIKGLTIIERPGRKKYIECTVTGIGTKLIKRFNIDKIDEAKKWVDDNRKIMHGEFYNNGTNNLAAEILK